MVVEVQRRSLCLEWEPAEVFDQTDRIPKVVEREFEEVQRRRFVEGRLALSLETEDGQMASDPSRVEWNEMQRAKNTSAAV